MIFVALLSTAVFADGGFYGEVTYKDCDAVIDDKVWIEPLGGAGEPVWYGIDHLHQTHTYNTGLDTFPPGSYKLWVTFGATSECVTGDIRIITHGSTNQQVDLKAYGDTGHPDGGGGE